MYTVSDFRRGLPIIVDDQPFYVVEYQHFKMGRGKANIRTKLRHIKTGSVIEKVFSSNDVFKPPDLENRRMQYLYESAGEATFMDVQNFEQITVTIEKLGDVKWYLIENSEYQVLFLDNAPISVELPAAVTLQVTATEPVVRGDTVSNVTKPATVSTGLEVRVPPFVKEGDMIRIDTRTGEYLERA